MLFSLVIPVYNVAQYLPACIRSVMDNHFADMEILLIDDGSTDGLCPQMCDDFAAKYPALVRVIHQENKGLGGARNTGLQAAKGAYVLFLDSDDTLVPHALSTLAERVLAFSPDVVSFHMYSWDGAEGKSPVRVNHFCADAPFTLKEKPAFLLSLPTATCRLWRREWLLQTGIVFPEKVWYEDIRTTTKLFALAASIYTLDEPLYCYLQRPGSIMNSVSLERNREIMDAFADMITWFQAEGLYDMYAPLLTHLAVEHLYLTASVRVARQDPKHPLLKEFSAFMQEHFPRYRDTFSAFSKKHRLLLSLLERGHYSMIKALFAVMGKG